MNLTNEYNLEFVVRLLSLSPCLLCHCLDTLLASGWCSSRTPSSLPALSHHAWLPLCAYAITPHQISWWLPRRVPLHWPELCSSGRPWLPWARVPTCFAPPTGCRVNCVLRMEGKNRKRREEKGEVRGEEEEDKLFFFLFSNQSCFLHKNYILSWTMINSIRVVPSLHAISLELPLLLPSENLFVL